jgi:hypothetical protein
MSFRLKPSAQFAFPHLLSSSGFIICHLTHHCVLIAIPPKVDEAFRAFRYVPYSSLTMTARVKAARGEEDVIFNAQGGLTVKSLDRRNEKLISTVDWYASARAAEDRIRFYHGDVRATAFAAHHKLVMDLARSHNWDIAMEYDIQQRELVSLNPSHDLSSLDNSALTVIATRAAISPSPAPSPTKRPAPSEGSFHPPKKRQRSHCFRCGASGHFPADCKAEQTVSGRPTAKLAPSSKSKHAMLAPNGKQFCFTWSRSSSCTFGDSCTNFHGCSICGESNHGAGSCKSAT